MEKSNRVKLYVVWPFLHSQEHGEPRLFSAEFTRLGDTYYHCAKYSYPDEVVYRAFGWCTHIPQNKVHKGQKLSYGGYPALTAAKAEGRWREHLLQGMQDGSERRKAQIEKALQQFKRLKEIKK